MIKNYHIEKLNGKEKEYIKGISDNAVTHDQDRLKADLGRSLLMSHQKEQIIYNNLRWHTPSLGTAEDLNDLHPTDPYILKFSEVDVIGDRAINTTSGWYFTNSRPGVYRISTNAMFKLYTATEGTTKILFDNYIPTIEPCEFSIYKNDTQFYSTEILISSWQPTNNNYYVNYDRLGSYRFTADLSILTDLAEGDKIDIRAGFIQYSSVEVCTLTYYADININLVTYTG